LTEKGGATESNQHIAEKDFRNVLNIVDFCLKHDNFPSPAIVKDLMNELLTDFDHNAFRLKSET